MKLVRETFLLFYFLLIIGILIIEACFFVITYYYSNKYVNDIFDHSTGVSIDKLSVILALINNSTINLFSKFRSDLILIGKHMKFLKDINTNLQYYKNYKNNEYKEIISSNYEEIITNDILIHYYDNITNQFNYILQYDINYDNSTSPSKIIDILLNSSTHKELDLIGYYDSKNNSLMDIDSNTFIFGKYLISILKSLFINRYFIKGSLIEYTRFIFIHENECFIYPPEAYNNTNSYKFSKNILNSENFPYSVYSFLNNHLDNNYSFITIINGYYLSPCLTIPFYNDIDFSTRKNIGYICVEINIENLFVGNEITKRPKLEVLAEVNEDLSLIYYDYRRLNFSNIEKIFNKSDFLNYQYKINERIQFFHLLYYDLFSNDLNNVNINDILKEYETIYTVIINEINKYINANNTSLIKKNKTIDFYINRTSCHENMNSNKVKCEKELFLIVIQPLIISNVLLDNNFFILKSNNSAHQNVFYTIAVLATNEGFSKKKVSSIILIKLMKTSLYYLLMSFCLASVATLLLMLIFRNYFNGLEDITRSLEKFLFYTKKSSNTKTLCKFNCSPNKEMKELSKILNSININYILKKSTENHTSNSEISKILEESLNHIKNKDIKNKYIMIIAHYYYGNGFYEKAENKFSSLLNFINEKENSYLINNEYDENKIKDTISRKSKSAYVNEFSSFKGISDNILTIIKIKLLKQKINYLHGMSIFKILLENNRNKNYIFKNRKKNDKYLKDAINNFQQCKEINNSLGINPIIEIFSLIMISRCFMIVSNYKNAISNLTEALGLFERLTEIVKDESGEKFNPKVMLFVLNFIFQSIMLSISQACFFFNKNYTCNWISIKILETSPFIINNIFYENCFFSQNSMRALLKRRTLSNNTNTVQMQAYYSKIFSRIHIRFKKDKLWKNKLNFYNFANPLTTTMKRVSIKIDLSKSDNFKSLFSKESKYLLKKYKLITICISEKVILDLNGAELKDVLVKYLQKFFVPNDNDSFSFIQFTFNGKKSIYLKPERLDFFLKRFQNNKDVLRITEYLTNNEVKLSELYNLLYFMIKQQKEELNKTTIYKSNQNSGSLSNSNLNSSEAHNSSSNKKIAYLSNSSNNANNFDRIILLFIKSEDLRFNSQDECINIVNDLNKNNCTIVFFCYDEDIKMDKIFNIYCLLDGLFDGYLIQVKNYQQIKQFLMNFSNQNYQENFSKLNLENLELIL